MRTCSLLVVAGFLGLEPLEHVTVLVGVVPAAESIAPDEREAMGIATVFWVLGFVYGIRKSSPLSLASSSFASLFLLRWLVSISFAEGEFSVFVDFGFCCTAPIQHWIVDYFGGKGSFAVWPSTPLFTRVAGHSSREMLVSTVDTRLSLKPFEDFHTFSLARVIRCGSRFSSCSPEPDQSGLVCVLVARTSLLVWGNTRTPDLSDVGSSLGVKLTRGAGIDRHIVRRSRGSLRHVVLQACRLCESAHARGLRSRGRFLSFFHALRLWCSVPHRIFTQIMASGLAQQFLAHT